MALPKAKELVSSNPVVVFSKSYCPFCVTVKQLLSQLGATLKAIELDTESDGAQIQSALAEWTGQRTVPNVFIGGCDCKKFCVNDLTKKKKGSLTRIPLPNHYKKGETEELVKIE
ncbi:hypothetical protein UlMin_024559 [Ulmus minor]